VYILFTMETTMSDSTTDTTADTAADATQTTESPKASLQLSTLFQAVQIMQVASERGAFKAEELTQVGGVYDAIVAFLQASGAIAPVADTTTDTTADSQATDATETDATAPADA
jgi:hypothetical protein